MGYQEVTETIIGCAYRVYNKMGFGFLESVYETGKLVGLILHFGEKKLKLNVKSRIPFWRHSVPVMLPVRDDGQAGIQSFQ